MGNDNSARPMSYRIGPVSNSTAERINQPRTSNVPELPPELWFHIFSYIDFNSIQLRNKIRTTARSIKSIVDEIVKQQQIAYKLKDELLMKAITNNDLDHLKYLHSMGVKVNFLKQAIDNNCSLPFIEFLCMHGAASAYNVISHAVERFDVVKIIRKYEKKWGYSEHSIPAYYASQGELDKLKWVREQGCSWNEATMRMAVCGGHLNVVKYCHENQCPHNQDLTFYAAFRGHLRVLEYLHEKGYPWGDTLNGAVENDRVDILRWAIDQGCPTDSRMVCWNAAARGSLKCLQYAHEHGCPWDNSVLSVAVLKKQKACEAYARANGLTEEDEP